MRAIKVNIDLVQPQPEYFDRAAMNDRGARLESEFSLTDQGLRRRCLVLTADTFAVTSDAGHLAARGAVVVLPQAAIPFRLNPAWPRGFAWNIPDSRFPASRCHATIQMTWPFSTRFWRHARSVIRGSGARDGLFGRRTACSSRRD